MPNKANKNFSHNQQFSYDGTDALKRVEFQSYKFESI